MCMTGAILGSAVIGGISSSRAASAQTEAAERQAEVQEKIYKENVERFDPYYQSGLTAQNALMYELGLGPRPGAAAGGANALTINEIPGSQGGGGIRPAPGANFRNIGDGREYIIPGGGRVMVNSNRDLEELQARYGGGQASPSRYQVGDQTFDSREAAQSYIDNQSVGSGYQGFRATPGYQFRVQEGVNALDASAASGGGLYSGASAKALTEFGQNIGSQEYGNYMNRLTGVASNGQNAAGQQAAAGQNYATGMSNAYGAMGNAQAAGAIGMGNAITGGINNWIGYQQMNKLLG